MKVFDILNYDTEVKGWHFLEASAGTGKTFSIQHAVTRLLIDDEAPCKINEILVVTFTRAATRELKHRIYQNLKEAHTQLKQRENSGVDYLNQLIIHHPERVDRAMRLLEEAIALFDEAQIYTIHSFVFQMLARFGIEAGVHFHLSDPDSTDHEVVLMQEIEDYLHARVNPERISSAQLAHFMNSCSGDPEKMSRAIAKLSSVPSHLEKTHFFGEIADLLATELTKLAQDFDIESAKFYRDYELLKPCYKRMTEVHFDEQAQFLGLLLEKEEIDRSDIELLLQEKTHFLSRMVEANLKVRAKWPGEKLAYPSLFESLCKSVLHRIEFANDSTNIKLALAYDFAEYWEQSGKGEITLSPDRLLQKMEEALDRDRFVAKLKPLYQAAIIDEFQDTDRVQWNIFKTLFCNHADDKTLYLVGDPKQSIYAFRRADLYTYLEAQQTLGERAHRILSTNYRSEPLLLSGMNNLFSDHHSGKWLNLPELKSALEYIPVHSPAGKKSTSFCDIKAPVHFWMIEGKMGRERKWPTPQIEEESLIVPVIHEIIRLEKEEEIPLTKMAVLIKDRHQAARVMTLMRNAAIPATVKQQASLLDSPALETFISLIEALIQPDDQSSLKKVMTTPLFQLDDDKVTDTHTSLLLKVELTRLRDRFFRDGIEGVLNGVLNIRLNKASVIEELISHKHHLFYEELQQLSNILSNHEQEGSLSLYDHLHFLKTLKHQKGHFSNLYPAIHLPDSGGVNIMTTHMSKGLEFDIVFVLGLATRTTVSEEVVYLKTKEKISKFDPSNPECALILQELDAEKMRQLYVGLTRAKKRVYMPVIEQTDGKEIKPGLGSPIELFLEKALKKRLELSDFEQWVLSMNDKNQFSTEKVIAQNLSHIRAHQESKKLVKPLHVELFFSGKVHTSFTTLSRIDGDEKKAHPLQLVSAVDNHLKCRSTERVEEIKKTMHSLPQGAETGVVLHRIFEKLIASGNTQLRNLHWKEFVVRELESTKLSPWTDAVLDMVKAVLKTPLTADENGVSLIDVSPDKMIHEMEFLLPLGDTEVKGFIDLVLEHEGKYYIVDWKSNYLGESESDYCNEKVWEAMEHHQYPLQATIYARALKEYLSQFTDKPFKTLFGGAIYCFLRGNKMVHFNPEMTLLEEHGILV